MTFTIHVPIFPMRKEIDERRQRRAAALQEAGPARGGRPRDVEGFIELELLPRAEIDALGTRDARAQRRKRRS